MTYLIDTHSHVDMIDFETIDEVIAKAKSYGVEKIINPSVDANNFDTVINLANEHKEIYCALGIHPTELNGLKDEDFDKMRELASHPKVVGIGECGLDYHWDKSNTDVQKKVFLKQIEIAKELKLPLLIHDRDAHKDSFDLLSDNVHGEIPVIMHCFSGSWEFAQECIKKGYYLALGGVVTFKNAKKVHEVAKEIPLDSLLLETDAPYLTPEPHRGEPNEPAYVKFVAERIAQIREISVEELAEITTANARKIFGF